jgi:hypothetical protein
MEICKYLGPEAVSRPYNHKVSLVCLHWRAVVINPHSREFKAIGSMRFAHFHKSVYVAISMLDLLAYDVLRKRSTSLECSLMHSNQRCATRNNIALKVIVQTFYS